MNIMGKIQKDKLLEFFVRTILPFTIPFIFEIPNTMIVFGAKFVIVVILSAIDLILIFALDKEEKRDKQLLFKNYAARCAYSRVYELNESKRDYYIESAEYGTEKIPYNPRNYLDQISQSFRDVIGEITRIEKEYISVMLIYRIKETEWKLATRRESTFTVPLGKFLKKENTLFYTLINGGGEGASIHFEFYNDKAKMAEKNKYYLGSRDHMHNDIGSIMGFRFSFGTDKECLVDAILVISTYGRRLIEDDNPEDVSNLKRLISDDLFPCYKRIFETELGILYFEEHNKGKNNLVS